MYIKTITESILWLTQCRQQAQSIHNYTISSGTWVSLWNICVTNDDGYVPLVVIRMSPFPHYLLTVVKSYSCEMMYTDSNDRNTHSHDMKHSSHAAGISYKIMSKHIDIFLISNAI